MTPVTRSRTLLTTRALSQVGVGLLLGLTPLALVALGVGALYVQTPANPTGGWVAWFSWIAALAAILGSATAILPLLWLPGRRALGVGLVVGLALSCYLLVIAMSSINLEGFFY
jgi:hypothetical protein